MSNANIDVRGRGSSGEVLIPFYVCKNGYDIVEWFAKQSYCRCKSYNVGVHMRQAQWLTAKEFPPHLKSIVPVASQNWVLSILMRLHVGRPHIQQWLKQVITHSGTL
jgi:predicted acyl esterase